MFNMENKRCANGFTLIELLVVIVVLSFVGAIVVAILVSTLRGSQKTNVITEVRQNGNYAISIMARMIRNSQKINSCSGGRIDITNPDGGRTIFSCGSSNIASNSANLFPASVPIKSCTISCGSLVTISFTAQSSSDQKVSIPFQTSIQVRNY